ncbi:hypothetical protein D8O27_29025 [Burkholderia mallei]|uniref:Uncharacterized protein n=2 Tax=Burkholderia mallei TaxID=13373 RepID=A0AAX1X3A7_BURML|nr:hypothetical protein BMA3355 [Burkholderia mallei ATCC 23344]RKN90890.1 hypothetical protein D8O31_29300 [Burkholderia mallei]RKN92415.1 hypothetical protein D8O03_29255 [Burkholderia mallei]RKN94481.1 hypothetical protein D8O05_28520 [Burkholderia mallei]RKO06909.1 hypothetical protein D8O04_28720 [Burkholderia mallei]
MAELARFIARGACRTQHASSDSLACRNRPWARATFYVVRRVPERTGAQSCCFNFSPSDSYTARFSHAGGAPPQPARRRRSPCAPPCARGSRSSRARPAAQSSPRRRAPSRSARCCRRRASRSA